MAAAYTLGIIQNHPFIDGNKRTGFIVGVLFLEMNGRRFTAPEEEATQAILRLASGTLREQAFIDWLRKNVRVDRGTAKRGKK
jgi:death-on-curing protein